MGVYSIFLIHFVWLRVPVLGQQDAFHDEERDGKLQMTAEDRHKYWEKTYSDPRAKAGKDWYGPWKEFQKDVAGPAFRQSDEILVVGCGNSNLPADLARQGFSVVGMDYSKRKVIKLQRARFPDIKWIRADLRRMPRFKDKSFDIVIEKALMDGEGAFREWPLMFSEISRVLRPGGRFISISLGQPEELNTELFFRCFPRRGRMVKFWGVPKKIPSIVCRASWFEAQALICKEVSIEN